MVVQEISGKKTAGALTAGKQAGILDLSHNESSFGCQV